CIISLLTHLFLHYFLYNVPPTTELYTLSLHDALPIFHRNIQRQSRACSPSQYNLHHSLWLAVPNKGRVKQNRAGASDPQSPQTRSEEHTSELQSRENLVCRLLLEKKNKKTNSIYA